MPELPEIIVIAKQMNQIICGKEIGDVSVFQTKCLNRPEKDYQKHVPGKIVDVVQALGKWVVMNLEGGVRFLISLGMGGEICYIDSGQDAPEKSRLILHFTDETGFYVTLWWFGYFHLVLQGEEHQMTDTLGHDPLEISVLQFQDLLDGRRGGVKSFLLNQKRIRGIGNFYIQEILFRARLHPLREIPSLSDREKDCLFNAIQQVLQESIELGSSSYELDFFGKKGKYGANRMSFAYRQNALCPVCGSKTEKIKTGSTMQYVCTGCQRLK